ncbi:hypothetical protein CA052_04630 [Salmonella enterica]|nr:hypothetical protein [Salmonella enterica]EBN1281770.1 hypothetical protein [Salmonella enterica]
MSIGIDITPSCDTPDLQDYSDVLVNHGVGITCLNYHGRGTLAGLITPPRLLRMLEMTAHENSIPVHHPHRIPSGTRVTALVTFLAGTPQVAAAKASAFC